MAKQVTPAPRPGRVRSEGVPVAPPDAQGDHYPAHQPTPFFFFEHHPSRWRVIDGELLPQLRAFPVSPGNGGVDERGRYDNALVNRRRKGWTHIPNDVIPDGYVRRHCVKGHTADNPRYLHTDKWTTPVMLGNRPDFETDLKGYKEFLRLLVSEGVIEPPDPIVLEGVAAQYRKKLEDLVSSGKANERQIAQAEAEVEAVQSSDFASPVPVASEGQAVKPPPAKGKAKAGA